jgi:hypothetical protein
MYGNRYDEGRHYYVCRPSTARTHSNSISGHGTDEVITELVLARLANEDLERPAATWDGEHRLGEIAEQIGALMAAFVDKRLSESVVFPAVEALESERDALRAARARWAADTAGPVVRRMSVEEWQALDVDRRRAILETVFDGVMVRPAVKRQNTLDLDRIVPVWKGQL